MEDSFFVKHSKLISLIAIFGIVFCILLVIIIFIHKKLSQKTYLTLQFAPNHAIIELDGTDLALSQGTYEIAPGDYTGTIKANNFIPKSVNIHIDAHQVNSYTDYLVHTTRGLAYFEKNAADMTTLHQIRNTINAEEDQNLISFLDNYDYKASIYDLLPLTISWYKYVDDTPMYNLTITNGTNHPKCTGTLCLSTKGPKENIAELTKALTERGYDINDYEVFYEYSAI